MRAPQPEGTKGSLKWTQRAIEEQWDALEGPILAAMPGASRIDWLSPLRKDEFAEYRDAAFLDRLSLTHLTDELANFWPARGPQWDALARTSAGQVLLIEAKAHIGEFCSPASVASNPSLTRIMAALRWLAEQLDLPPESGDQWHRLF